MYNFLTYIKISKDSSSKYSSENKERLQKKRLLRDILPKWKKKKSSNMGVNNTKIFPKMKNKSNIVYSIKQIYNR